MSGALTDGVLSFLTVSPDGNRVAVTASDPQKQLNRLLVCEVGSGECLFSADGGALAYSPDGRWLERLSRESPLNSSQLRWYTRLAAE